MKRVRRTLIAFFILTCSVPVFAQKKDAGKPKTDDLGFLFYTGLPLSGQGFSIANMASLYRTFGIGLAFPVSPSLSLEPGVFFANTNAVSTDQNTGSSDSDDQLYLGASLGIFYYKPIQKTMFFYTGPRLEFGYNQRKEDNSSGDVEKYKRFDIGIVAVVGLKCMITDKLGVFGDIGLGYYYTNYTREATGSSPYKYRDTIHSFTLSKALIGVILSL